MKPLQLTILVDGVIEYSFNNVVDSVEPLGRQTLTYTWHEGDLLYYTTKKGLSFGVNRTRGPNKGYMVELLVEVML